MPSTSPGPADTLIELLQSFSIQVDRFVGVFADAHGLHRTDLNAIAHIWGASRLGEPLTPKALAERLTLSPPATTALLDRLERGGYVVRRPDTIDRRRVFLHGQDSAQRVAQGFFMPLGQALRQVMAGYPDAQLAVAHDVMTAVLAATAAVADAAANHGPPAAPVSDAPARRARRP